MEWFDFRQYFVNVDDTVAQKVSCSVNVDFILLDVYNFW